MKSGACKVIAAGDFQDGVLINTVKKWAKSQAELYGYVLVSDKSMVFFHVEEKSIEAKSGEQAGEEESRNKYSSLFGILVEAGCEIIQFVEAKKEGFNCFHVFSGNEESYISVADKLAVEEVRQVESSLEYFPENYRSAARLCYNKLFHASLKLAKVAKVEQISPWLRKLIPLEHIPSTANSKINLSEEFLGASYTAAAWQQRYYRQEIKRLEGHALDFELESKKNGYLFADLIGVRRPDIIAIECKVDDIEPQFSIVIKPTKSANLKGVFVVNSQGQIKDLENDVFVKDFSRLKEVMRGLVSCSRLKDSWIVEELIEGEGNGYVKDLKFYTFYGEVGLVQEEKREPTQFCYYDEHGNIIETGRYGDKKFVGEGFSSEYLELAKKISLDIPSPMVRIDFLVSSEGPVLGEFTPGPGNFHKFNMEIDRSLGVKYSRARARLFLDLCKGKEFGVFKQYLQKVSP